MNSITDQNAAAYNAKATEWAQQANSNDVHLYLEKPAMKKLLPENLEHQSILCIGVGTGEELTELIKQNPRKITAIDIALKLLEIAHTKFPSVEFLKMDMNELEFPAESFDFIYSGLAFHYAPDWDKLLAGVYRVLKPGGKLLFSTHHPDYWQTKTATGQMHKNERGVALTEHQTTLPAGIEIVYYNHPSLESIVDSVNHANFKTLAALAPEVIPVPAELRKSEREAYESLVKQNRKHPLIFVVLAQKSTS